MGERSNIEWTDATWNPIRGCSRVSEGCRNCYAERQAIRQAGPGKPYEGLVRIAEVGKKREPRWTGKVVLDREKLGDPLHWKKPRRVFVNSMSDLFHEQVWSDWIQDIFQIMARCPQHTFQILTKRPERMRGWLLGQPVLPNVWLGTSVEDQETAEKRIPELFKMPAAVRWISAEPLLGPINIRKVHIDPFECFPHNGLDWVVVGGESGPGARPMALEWARSIVADCQSSKVPVFVKQLGAYPVISDWEFKRTGRLLSWKKSVATSLHVIALQSKKGGEPAEWPEDLRVREYPKETHAA